MKKSCRVVLSLALLCAGLSVASVASAQQAPVAGGYSEASVGDAEVVAAARYAVSAASRKERRRISLVSIRRAEVQVVAGLNYRLGLTVNAGSKREDVTAVVYKNLKRQYSLTRWDVEASGRGGGTPPSTSSIEQLARSLADAYLAKEMGRLDTQRPVAGRVRVVIEHSLADDNSREKYESRQFRTLAQAERWLRSRERDGGYPTRQTMPLTGCSRGTCRFNFDAGILHNNLYLQKIGYVMQRGRPVIKTIYFLDGD